MSRAPNFLVIGAPRCGTTSLHRFLSGHPNVFMPTWKEPSYWSGDLRGWQRVDKLDQYLRLFRKAGPQHTAIGEASTLYLYSQEAPRRVFDFNPQMRILVLLRSPMELVPSWHAHLLRTCDEDVPDLLRAWDLSVERRQGRRIPSSCRVPALLDYKRIGKLAADIHRWREVFPSEQMCCLLLENLLKPDGSARREVLEFLGVPVDGHAGPFPHENENKRRLHRWWTQMLPQLPTWLLFAADRAKHTLGVRSFGLHRLTARPASRVALPPRLRAEMCDEFADDIRKLGLLLGRDLSGWLDKPADEPVQSSCSQPLEVILP